MGRTTRRVSSEGELLRAPGRQRGPEPAHDIGIWIGAYKPRMLALTGRKGDGWLPSLPYLQPGDLARGNAAIDAAARAAGRDPSAIRRMLNLPPAPLDEVLRLAREERIDTFIFMADDPGQIQSLAVIAEEARAAWREAAAVAAEQAGEAGWDAGQGGDGGRGGGAAERGDRGRGGGEAERGDGGAGRRGRSGAERRGVARRRWCGGAPRGAGRHARPRPRDHAARRRAARPRHHAHARRRRAPQRPDALGRVRASAPRARPGRELHGPRPRRGKHLIDVHDMLRKELDELRDLVNQVREGAISAGDARSMLNEMALRQNDWTLGAFCSRYCRVVATHHSLEDDSIFPHLARDPELEPVIDRLTEEHHVIHDAIEAVDRALVAHILHPEDFDPLQNAIDLLTDALLSHLSYEEHELVEPLARLGFYPGQL